MSFKKAIPYILVGSFILAFGLFNINDQNSITEGGSLGLGLLIKNLFDISPAISLLILDIIAFAMGIKFFGKSFLLKSIFATICFSLFYAMFEQIGFVLPNLEEQKLLAAILAGLFVGVGAGTVVSTQAASNGDDSIALVIDHITKIGVGKVYLIMDVVVIILSLTYLSFGDIFYSLIAVTISSFTIDKIVKIATKANMKSKLEIA